MIGSDRMQRQTKAKELCLGQSGLDQLNLWKGRWSLVVQGNRAWRLDQWGSQAFSLTFGSGILRCLTPTLLLVPLVSIIRSRRWCVLLRFQLGFECLDPQILKFYDAFVFSKGHSKLPTGGVSQSSREVRIAAHLLTRFSWEIGKIRRAWFKRKKLLEDVILFPINAFAVHWSYKLWYTRRDSLTFPGSFPGRLWSTCLLK